MDILTSPNPVLTQKTKDVLKVDKKITDLIRELFDVLSTKDGVGLAAPQIGQPYNVAVLFFEPTAKHKEEDPDVKPIPRTVLINPRIVWESKEKDTLKEACFSVLKTEIAVPRAKKIHVEFLDENGVKKKIKAKGYFARAIQHEIDHLQGKVITDYK
ncbi:MAG: peptide deformylase [Candidatus Berkelbacteria bacterium]|nr:peptide deformylase [Candidatus Berkelbacteria bacterium]